MTSTLPAADTGADLAPLLLAKGRIPPLPRPHVPRPRLVATLAALTRTHRLVVLSAGSLAGKTTLLAEFARAGAIERVFWYSIDEVDKNPRVLLEGLAQAVGAAAMFGDEMRLVAQIVRSLDAEREHTLLMVDDIHRSGCGASVLERILRYLPPRAHVLLGGQPRHAPPPALYQWLEDRGQVAYMTGADLLLDEDERDRFRTYTGRHGGVWAVDYRCGGEAAIVDGLRRGVLPTLDPNDRAMVDLLCVLPVATAAMLRDALYLDIPDSDVSRRLDRLRDETVLVEQVDAAHYRLGEMARRAALAGINERTLAALRLRAASALEQRDPAQAAHLFAQGGDAGRAVAAVRRVSWWDWQRWQALAMDIAALLPPASLRRAAALALTVARLRLIDRGPLAIHAAVRALRPTALIDRIERLRLLAHCATARDRTWSLGRCVVQLEALTTAPDPRMSALERSYGLAALGVARTLAAQYPAAVGTLRTGLDLLTLDGADTAPAAHVRLLATVALAVALRRLGDLDGAERLYADAQVWVRRDGMPHLATELTNNRAVLLQQRGEHTRSAEMLAGELMSPWGSEIALRGLLNASLADALDALGDRAGAARALRAALDDVQERDVYGLSGHLHARRALLMAEGGHVAEAIAEINAGAPPDHGATRLARALLHDPSDAEVRPVLRQALNAATDVALRAQVQAHLARVCALQGDRPQARRHADAVVGDTTYPLTPREAAILGSGTRRVRQPRALDVHASSTSPITLRFFGPPAVYIGGRPLGSAWWPRSKGREILWYALAHGGTGFTREEAIADLFPDMDAEAGGRALRNALHELRKLLRARCGVGKILVGTDRLRLLPEELGASCDADTRTLEDHLDRLRAGETNAATGISALLAGHYLADLHADWTHPFRHYWEREALHALDLAAAHYERAGQAAEALACLRREADFSPDDPALVRRVMRLYHAVGDQSGLRAAYLSHRRALRDDLDVEPDVSVTELYDALTRS